MLKELKEWALLFLTYIICVGYLLGITLPCDEKYQAENGNLCYPCSEGFYKVSDCVVNGEQARCRPCRNGEYQPSCDNSTKCDHCKLFCIDPRQVKVKNCTATSDIECLCKAGFYWKPSTWKPDEGYCDSHSKCGAGEGLVEKGTPYKNTKCEPCEEGVTYSSNASFDTCVPCSVCNSAVAFKCITTRDVVCGALHDKPSPTEGSSEDGGKDNVLETVVLVLVPLVVVSAKVWLGCCFYRRRRNKGNVTSAYSKLKQVYIHNGITHNSMTNGFHQPARDLNIHSQGSDDDSKSNGAFRTTSSQNKCTSSEASDNDFRSDFSKKSMEEVLVRHETQNDITGEEQETTDDIVQNSKHITLNATPENKTRNNCSNSRAEMLQGRLNTREIKNMKKKSQYTETHRSDLGDRSATSRVVKGETILDLSVDAAGVSPRHEVQRVSISTCTSGENMSDPDDADLTTRTNVCFEIDDSGTGTQPDENYAPTTTQASSVRAPTSSSAAEVSVWLEVYFFMSRNLSWDKFKMVYRRLTWKTNSELHETVEPDMDNALIEAHSKSQEAMYKLMVHWRQATPDAVIIHVFQALEGCQQKLLSEKLQSVVEKTRAPVNIAFGQISDNGQNVVEAPARGELPTSYTLQSVNIDTNGIAANGHCANNLRMMELKI